MCHRPRQRPLGAQPHPAEELAPCLYAAAARHRQRAFVSLAVGEQNRVAADRKRGLGLGGAQIDADRRARRVRVDWPALRLLDLKQLHAKPLTRGSDVERLTTAAAALFVWIAEGKTALQFLFDVVHLG